MPIQLTTPISVGDLDPAAISGQYAQVRICGLEFDFVRKTIGLRCEYGNTVSGKWVSGKKEIRVAVQDEVPTFDANGDSLPCVLHYSDMVATLPANTTSPLYTQVGDALYHWLIDEGYLAGTVV